MEIDELNKLFKSFCAKGDEVRPVLNNPFVQELDGRDAICATEGHALIIKKNAFGYESIAAVRSNKPDVSLAIPKDECVHEITYDMVNSALGRVPTSNTEYVECPNCDGFGKVEWNCVDINGKSHANNFQCPWCYGRGVIKHSCERHLSDNYFISIDGIPLQLKFTQLLCNALKCLGTFKCVGCGAHTLKLENEDYIMMLSGIWASEDLGTRLIKVL